MQDNQNYQPQNQAPQSMGQSVDMQRANQMPQEQMGSQTPQPMSNSPMQPNMPEQLESKTITSPVVWVLLVLLVLTLIGFGGYVLYNETNSNSETKEDSISQDARPTPTTKFEENEDELDTIEPSVAPSPKITDTVKETVVVDIPGVDSSVRSAKYQFTKPTTAIFTTKRDPFETGDDDSKRAFVEGSNFTLMIISENEDESYGGTSYKDNYKKIFNANYGSLYRVQNDWITEERGENTYSYVNGDNFLEEGSCVNFFDEEVKAPCGNSMFFVQDKLLLTIYCNASTESGLNECDRIVESLKKL